MIRWLKRSDTTHAFRDGKTTSLCGIATLDGPWRRAHTPRCVLCEKKAEGGLAKIAERVPKVETVARRFDGQTGRTPQAEARRYVYAVLQAMLDHELTDVEGRIFGGIEHEDDKRRLRYAVELTRAELGRKI